MISSFKGHWHIRSYSWTKLEQCNYVKIYHVWNSSLMLANRHSWTYIIIPGKLIISCCESVWIHLHTFIQISVHATAPFSSPVSLWDLNLLLCFAENHILKYSDTSLAGTFTKSGHFGGNHLRLEGFGNWQPFSPFFIFAYEQDSHFCQRWYLPLILMMNVVRACWVYLSAMALFCETDFLFPVGGLAQGQDSFVG